MDGPWLVVVARTGPSAKSRLAPFLTERERASLALAMLEDVLRAAASTSPAPYAGKLVVTDTAAGLDLARALGYRAIPCPGAGMNAAVALGLRAVLEARGASALVLPGDLPCLAPADVEALYRAAGSEAPVVVVGEDRAGVGTNALFLSPPGVIAPSFGAGSAARHAALAARAGARWIRLSRPSLADDVDLPADLLALRGNPAAGPATALALERLLPLHA